MKSSPRVDNAFYCVTPAIATAQEWRETAEALSEAMPDVCSVGEWQGIKFTQHTVIGNRHERRKYEAQMRRR